MEQMPNIEIKARYPDAEAARNIAREIQASHIGLDSQIDTYFKTVEGRLKLRESTLKGAELVPYLRPNQMGPKKSVYMTIAVTDPEQCKILLSQILGVEAVVRKTRDFYLFENVRIYIDDVEGLGKFFEFEAMYVDGLPDAERDADEKVKRLMSIFKITPDMLESGSYRELALSRLAK